MCGRFTVLDVLAHRVLAVARAVVNVKLLGPLRAFEIMTLAGNGKDGNGQQQEGECFHRAASIATRQRKATPGKRKFASPEPAGNGAGCAFVGAVAA